MHIIFPKHPLEKAIDLDFQKEAAAAKRADFKTAYIDIESLEAGNIVQALRAIPQQTNTTLALYRGWMLRTQEYALLSSGLSGKNIKLLTKPEEYENAHHLPNTYDLLKHVSPKAAIVDLPAKLNTNNDFTSIHNALLVFNSKPLVIKDFVKSRKHDWENACFIREANDQQEVERVTRNFVRGQGTTFTGGLVYREWLPLEKSLAQISEAREFRAFILYGKVLCLGQRHTGVDLGEQPPINQFAGELQSIPSPFFTIDFAKVVDGPWIVIEIGDGAVSEIPESINLQEFYHRLAESLS
jgi:hypothetical protein